MDRRPPPDFYWQESARRAHDDWWHGPLHALFFLLFLALLVAGIVWLVRRLAPGVAQAAVPATAAPVAIGAAPADPAVATLRMRYAKGEVSREDFQNALADLTGAEAPTGSWPGNEPPEEAAS